QVRYTLAMRVFPVRGSLTTGRPGPEPALRTSGVKTATLQIQLSPKVGRERAPSSLFRSESDAKVCWPALWGSPKFTGRLASNAAGPSVETPAACISLEQGALCPSGERILKRVPYLGQACLQAASAGSPLVAFAFV
ncbi:unnamed protein product, partial [Pleuronectes platessa]